MKYNDKPNWDTLDKILSVSTDPNQYHKIDIYKLWLSVVMLNLYDEDRFDKIAEIADKLNVSFNDKSNSDYLMSRLLLSICYRELQEWDKSLETLLFINDMQIGIANDYGDESNNVISKSYIYYCLGRLFFDMAEWNHDYNSILHSYRVSMGPEKPKELAKESFNSFSIAKGSSINNCISIIEKSLMFKSDLDKEMAAYYHELFSDHQAPGTKLYKFFGWEYAIAFFRLALKKSEVGPVTVRFWEALAKHRLGVDYFWSHHDGLSNNLLREVSAKIFDDVDSVYKLAEEINDIYGEYHQIPTIYFNHGESLFYKAMTCMNGSDNIAIPLRESKMYLEKAIAGGERIQPNYEFTYRRDYLDFFYFKLLDWKNLIEGKDVDNESIEMITQDMVDFIKLLNSQENNPRLEHFRVIIDLLHFSQISQSFDDSEKMISSYWQKAFDAEKMKWGEQDGENNMRKEKSCYRKGLAFHDEWHLKKWDKIREVIRDVNGIKTINDEFWATINPLFLENDEPKNAIKELRDYCQIKKD